MELEECHPGLENVWEAVSPHPIDCKGKEDASWSPLASCTRISNVTSREGLCCTACQISGLASLIYFSPLPHQLPFPSSLLLVTQLTGFKIHWLLNHHRCCSPERWQGKVGWSREGEAGMRQCHSLSLAHSVQQLSRGSNATEQLASKHTGAPCLWSGQRFSLGLSPPGC